MKHQETKKPTTASDAQQKIKDQVTGKDHEGNNDSAPVHPGGEHKIKGWVEAEPTPQNKKTN